MADDYSMSPVGKTAKDSLERQGFDFPNTPDEVPHLPTDVSDLASGDLMALFSLHVAWCDYASAQVGLAVVQEREAERSLEYTEAVAWKDMPKAVSVTASKAMLALDSTVQDARAELDKAYAYRRLVSDLAARYERDAAVLSRELTRRTGEISSKSARRDRWST